VNEYAENCKLLRGLFWYDFFLKAGLQNAAGLGVKARRHMLRQHDGRFAENMELIFLLANQAQRHAHARGVTVRLKSDPATFKKYAELVESPHFRRQLLRAAANPTGPDAKAVLCVMQPLMMLSSENVPFSSLAMSQDVTRLYSLWYNYGPPAAFCTFSPDDQHNILALRMIFPTRVPGEFPETDDGFAEALRNGEERHLDLPIGSQALRERLAGNPVAAAEIYERLLRAVWSILLGIDPCHRGGPGSKKSTVPAGRRRGVFGLVVAAFGATEEQVRTALHHHFVVWGCVPPEVVMAHFVDLWPVVTECLDSMFRSQVSMPVHMADAARRALHIPPLRRSFQPSTSPADDAFRVASDSVAVQCNLHGHSHTCRCGAHRVCGALKASCLAVVAAQGLASCA